MTLHDLLRQFLEHTEIEKGRSQKTIENYQHYMGRFIEFAEKNGVKGPADINLDLIHSYRLHLNRLTDAKGEPIKKVTQNYHIIALRAFLKYLAKRDIDTLSAEKVDLAKQEGREVNFLTMEELDRLLAAPGLYVGSMLLRGAPMFNKVFTTDI